MWQIKKRFMKKYYYIILTSILVATISLYNYANTNWPTINEVYQGSYVNSVVFLPNSSYADFVSEVTVNEITYTIAVNDTIEKRIIYASCKDTNFVVNNYRIGDKITDFTSERRLAYSDIDMPTFLPFDYISLTDDWWAYYNPSDSIIIRFVKFNSWDSLVKVLPLYDNLKYNEHNIALVEINAVFLQVHIPQYTLEFNYCGDVYKLPLDESCYEPASSIKPNDTINLQIQFYKCVMQGKKFYPPYGIVSNIEQQNDE